MRVLLAEDDDDLRRLFARILVKRGHEVCEAADGLEALECLDRFRPDLILTDLMMPTLDGIELIRRIRARADLEAIPIVAMTAAPTLEAVIEAGRHGATDLLAKPVDPGDLLGCLERPR